jgi:hypothetical protein
MTPFNLCQIASIGGFAAIFALAMMFEPKAGVYISATFVLTSSLLVLGKILSSP